MSSSSTRCRVVFLMTRPDQGLSLPRAYTNGIAWIDGMGGDGMGSEEFSSVPFGSVHFTSPIPRFLMMIMIIIMMTMMMHSSCWLTPLTFFCVQGCSLGKQRGDDERGEGSEKASSADRWTGIAFTRSGLSSRCYAGDDSSSSLLGGRLVCSCFSGGSWIS